MLGELPLTTQRVAVAADKGYDTRDWVRTCRPHGGYSLADAPAGIRMRVGDDMLASLARLATGGHVELQSLEAAQFAATLLALGWSEPLLETGDTPPTRSDVAGSSKGQYWPHLDSGTRQELAGFQTLGRGHI